MVYFSLCGYSSETALDFWDCIRPMLPGQEIEIGLMKLYHATGKEKYRELAQHFIDECGKNLWRESCTMES